jgi:hypothetical protein
MSWAESAESLINVRALPDARSRSAVSGEAELLRTSGKAVWTWPPGVAALYPRAPNALPRFSSDSFAMLFFIEQL